MLYLQVYFTFQTVGKQAIRKCKDLLQVPFFHDVFYDAVIISDFLVNFLAFISGYSRFSGLRRRPVEEVDSLQLLG